MPNSLSDLQRDNLEMKKSMRPVARQADDVSSNDVIDHKSTSGSAFSRRLRKTVPKNLVGSNNSSSKINNKTKELVKIIKESDSSVMGAIYSNSDVMPF